MTRSLLISLAATALTACQPSNPSNTADASRQDEAGTRAPVTSEAPAPGDVAGSAGETNGFPAAMMGRWGLTAADCEPGRSDAKGLLTISADALRFYESRAVPGGMVAYGQTRVAGESDFTGEGQEWTRLMGLDVIEDGRALIRSEQGTDAMPEPLRYRKCPA